MPAHKLKRSSAVPIKGALDASKKPGDTSKPQGPRARALDVVKKFAPEHLDTVKKTKWVLELLQGLMADSDASSQAVQAQHATELAAAKQETASAITEGLETAGKVAQAKEEAAALQQSLAAAQGEVEQSKQALELADLAAMDEVEQSKQALEQAEMAAVVAATECVNMQKIAQAGSQGDKKARRVLALRAFNLKENLLRTKTDLKAQKTAVRQQAFKIEVMSRQQEVAAAAACELTEQIAKQQLASKQALKQSKSQSQSRLYQPKHVEDRPEPVPAVQVSIAAPRSSASVPASPSKPKLIKAGIKSDNTAVMQVSKNVEDVQQPAPLSPARMSPWGDAGVFFAKNAFDSPQTVPQQSKAAAI